MLVMDEPTSALDGESAEHVRRCIARLCGEERVRVEGGRRTGVKDGGVTVIVITHERGMMRAAGRVVVLKGGEAVEDGRFEDLMARRGGELRRLMSSGDGEVR